MKKYLNSLLGAIVLSFVAVLTVDAQTSRDFRPDYDYYGEEFDWRWDVRVRISDGINNGLLTRWEANRLYNRLENIEQKEYAYAADGFYDSWEQNDVWQDVQWLHNRVGLELRDFDRTYYGFNNVGFAFTGYPNWWYNGGYNFYRFDRSGFGSIHVGYSPQCFVPVWVPNRTVYVNNYRTYGHTYYRNESRRNQVVYNNNRVVNSRNVTNAPRNSGRSNSAVYNGNNGSRSETVNRPASRGAAVSRSISDNNSSVNRAESRTREYSRTVATTERPAASRSYEGRTESLNNTRSARSALSAVSMSSRSASSGSSVGSSAGRTKLPEARRSTSASNESRSATSSSSRRGN